MTNINIQSGIFSVVVLAAGVSTRMGKPKFLLKFDRDSYFLENIIKGYRSFGTREVIVVVNDTGSSYLNEHEIYKESEIKIVVNHHPEWDRFFSLKTGLKSLKNKKQQVFVHNVDNPFVNLTVLEAMAEKSTESDFISPAFHGKGGHPILISEKVVNEVVTEKHDALNLKEFLRRYSKYSVEVDDENILVNINTPEDYKNIIGIDFQNESSSIESNI
jgi:molybdenum cofactor cytidylyltransferase